MFPSGPAPTKEPPPGAPPSVDLAAARSAFLSVLRRVEEARARGPVPPELEREYDETLAALSAAEADARAAPRGGEAGGAGA